MGEGAQHGLCRRRTCHRADDIRPGLHGQGPGRSGSVDFDIAKRGTYHREFADNVEKCEYFVAVEWLQTFPSREAVREIGLFGNQNTVCKPTTPKWRFTVDRLKQKFPKFDDAVEVRKPVLF